MSKRKVKRHSGMFKQGKPGGQGKAMMCPVRLSQPRVTEEQATKILAAQEALGLRHSTDVIRWLIDNHLPVQTEDES